MGGEEEKTHTNTDTHIHASVPGHQRSYRFIKKESVKTDSDWMQCHYVLANNACAMKSWSEFSTGCQICKSVRMISTSLYTNM